MKLSSAVKKFIAFKRASGAVYRSEAYTLGIFCRAFPGRKITAVTAANVRKFIFGTDNRYLHYSRFKCLQVFYRFAISRHYVSRSPLPETKPKAPIASEPYIYSREELKRLFAEAGKTTARGWRDPLFGHTFRAILILLYGAGLRISEALSLKGEHVDLSSSLLTVRDTKFFKSRLVPISPQLSDVLRTYVAERVRQHRPIEPEDYFFTTFRGRCLQDQLVRHYFRRLCDRLWIRRTDGAHDQPRLHDLRHTFARHRLLAGYRSKEDLSHLLVGLSTYLGHSDLRQSQTYLTMTPELLSEANQRFERYAFGKASHVH